MFLVSQYQRPLICHVFSGVFFLCNRNSSVRTKDVPNAVFVWSNYIIRQVRLQFLVVVASTTHQIIYDIFYKNIEERLWTVSNNMSQILFKKKSERKRYTKNIFQQIIETARDHITVAQCSALYFIYLKSEQHNRGVLRRQLMIFLQ